jgi:hypothetical protein
MLCKQLWRAFPNIKEKEPNYREKDIENIWQVKLVPYIWILEQEHRVI